MFNKKDDKQIISFQPISPNTFFSEAQPVPSVSVIPEWYKNIKPHVDLDEATKKEKPKYYSVPKGTIKKCIPVLDALGAGYIYQSPIEVAFDEEHGIFGHNSEFDFISSHDGDQLNGFAASPHYVPIAFKWRNLNIIKTAPGWSCLFTHPLNRLDLPFQTLSGVVDTDIHPVPVNFPFLMKKGWSGRIAVGTPLVQIIPFKRAEWESKTIPFDPNDPAMFNATTLVEDNYKKKFWQKKKYG